MTPPMNDDELLSLLSDSQADDGPPSVAMEAAYAAFGWRTLEADLAELIEDSQVEVVGFHQGAAYGRLVTFETASGTVEVSMGQDTIEIVANPVPTAIVLRQLSESQELTVDEAGRASATGVGGSIRFEITWPEGSASTPWLTL